MDQELSSRGGTGGGHLRPAPAADGPRNLATCYAVAKAKVTAKDVEATYRKRYGKEPFVRLLPPGLLPSTKDVRGSNFCDIAWRVDGKSRRVVVVSPSTTW